jgi:uncharacterized coiled-coil protein SlyX
MRAVDERLSYLEGRSREQQVMVDGLGQEVANLRTDMNRGFEAVDRRFEAVDRRFEAIDRRFDGLDRKMEILDDRVGRQFVWLVGVQVMTLAAVVTSLAAILGALAGR